jgi:hypothetical protein
MANQLIANACERQITNSEYGLTSQKGWRPPPAYPVQWKNYAYF